MIQVPTLNLEAVPTNTVPILDDIPEVKQSVVDSYIQQLRSVARGPGASEADVKAALGADTPMTVEARDAPESAQAKQEYNQLLATPEPEITPAQFDIEDLVSSEGHTRRQPHTQARDGRDTRSLA